MPDEVRLLKKQLSALLKITSILNGHFSFESIDCLQVYAQGFNLVDGRRERVFETAIRFADTGKVKLHDMVTHKYPLDRYQDMIEVNMRKSANRAVKTVVIFP